MSGNQWSVLEPSSWYLLSRNSRATFFSPLYGASSLLQIALGNFRYCSQLEGHVNLCAVACIGTFYGILTLSSCLPLCQWVVYLAFDQKMCFPCSSVVVLLVMLSGSSIQPTPHIPAVLKLSLLYACLCCKFSSEGISELCNVTSVW